MGGDTHVAEDHEGSRPGFPVLRLHARGSVPARSLPGRVHVQSSGRGHGCLEGQECLDPIPPSQLPGGHVRML